MGITERQLAELLANTRGESVVRDNRAVYQHKKGEMTGTERRYEEYYLTPRLVVGEIAAYLYEGEPIKLAKRSTYCPDFTVYNLDGSREYHEVKGAGPVIQNSRTKWKIAAHYNPDCRFVWAREQKGGGFKIEVYQR
jgi:hypothetical protein